MYQAQVLFYSKYCLLIAYLIKFIFIQGLDVFGRIV